MDGVGYVLLITPIMAKMWRVFYIFHNPLRRKVGYFYNRQAMGVYVGDENYEGPYRILFVAIQTFTMKYKFTTYSMQGCIQKFYQGGGQIWGTYKRGGAKLI